MWPSLEVWQWIDIDCGKANSKFKGCEKPIDNCMLQNTAKYNTEICLWLASHLSCSVDHFDKLIFIFQLPNQAEKLKCNTLLTRLLHLKNSFFLPQFPWLTLCVSVCVYVSLSLRGTSWVYSVSPLSLISLQLSVRKQWEDTVKCLRRTLSEEWWRNLGLHLITQALLWQPHRLWKEGVGPY